MSEKESGSGKRKGKSIPPRVVMGKCGVCFKWKEIHGATCIECVDDIILMIDGKIPPLEKRYDKDDEKNQNKK